MVDKSLLHFTIFLCLLFSYWLYDQARYIDKVHKNMDKAAETIIKQNKAIEAQRFYIQLLEIKLLEEEDFYSDPKNQI